MSYSDQQAYQVSVGELQALFDKITNNGYQNIGPKVRDGAIMIELLTDFNQLPKGYYEELQAGSYQLIKSEDQGLFQYTLGPQSYKKHLYPPRQKLWSANKDGQAFLLEPVTHDFKKMAFWGIRSCDLAALSILDRVFRNNEVYQKNRENLLIVAINCTQPSGNCFCSATHTGPNPKNQFDFLLTEVISKNDHYFVVRCGSEQAAKLASETFLNFASNEAISLAEKAVANGINKMTRKMDPELAARTIKENPESDHWNKIAERCLSCANCTLVCPTCFCTTTEDVTELTGDHTSRWLRWDSCFNEDFSYIHGGKIRSSIKSRYRQWMSHKLSYWYDQFGTSGCVGCGRCITWCPVGIDITQEIEALRKKAKIEKVSASVILNHASDEISLKVSNHANLNMSTNFDQKPC